MKLMTKSFWKWEKVNVGRFFLGESIGKILMKLKEANFYGRIAKLLEICWRINKFRVRFFKNYEWFNLDEIISVGKKFKSYKLLLIYCKHNKLISSKIVYNKFTQHSCLFSFKLLIQIVCSTIQIESSCPNIVHIALFTSLSI